MMTRREGQIREWNRRLLAINPTCKIENHDDCEICDTVFLLDELDSTRFSLSKARAIIGALFLLVCALTLVMAFMIRALWIA